MSNARPTLDPRQRFGVVAGEYTRGRPTYPPALIDWLLICAGWPTSFPERAAGTSPRVADVGCGTGIATRLLAARGCRTIGIDPNPEMLAAARAAPDVPAPEYRLGEAAATGLPMASIDIVTVAQAFHWFDPELALAEAGRILVPGGVLAAFWNVRAARTTLMREYDALLRDFSREYQAKAARERRAIAILRAAAGAEGCQDACFPHTHHMEHATFLDRVRSASYVAHGVDDQAGFTSALEAFFERHQQAGRLAFEYDCIGLLLRPAPRT
jgi:SAM-dependent methyltransferase